MAGVRHSQRLRTSTSSSTAVLRACCCELRCCGRGRCRRKVASLCPRLRARVADKVVLQIRDEAQMQMLSGSERLGLRCSEPNNSSAVWGDRDCCCCRCRRVGMLNLLNKMFQEDGGSCVKGGGCPRENQTKSQSLIPVSFTRERRRWRFHVTCPCVFSDFHGQISGGQAG